ncbi:MAG: serine/threonine-protein kinase [Candidatus Obscuribacterales bacterium]
MTNDRREELKQPELVSNSDSPDATAPDQIDEFTEASAPHTQPEHLVGQIIGSYRLLSVLGQGGMSIVFKAKHLHLDFEVALKLLSPDRHIDRDTIRRFRQEGKALQKLQSKYIVAFREFNLHTDGRPYLVADLAAGHTLANHLKDKERLTRMQTARIGVDICKGLAEAHGQGIVHRDLKPSNVILSHDSSSDQQIARLLDFGIAKGASGADGARQGGETLTRTGEIVGSPPYMSPEQCKGLPVDGRTDVYALGCLLFECLDGKPPFAGQSVIETLSNHLHMRCPPVNSGNTVLDDIVARCLEKDPEKRYQCVSQVENMLAQILAGKGEDNSSARRQKTLRKVLILSVMGFFLVGLGAAAIKWGLEADQERRQLASVYHQDMADIQNWLWIESPMRQQPAAPNPKLETVRGNLIRQVNATRDLPERARQEIRLAQTLEQMQDFESAGAIYEQAQSHQKSSTGKNSPTWLTTKANGLRCRYKASIKNLVLINQLGYEEEPMRIIDSECEKLIDEIRTAGKGEPQDVLRGLYILRGNALFMLRRFEEAASQYQLSADMPSTASTNEAKRPNASFDIGTPSGIVLARWGDCERYLKHPEKAADLYSRALSEFLAAAKKQMIIDGYGPDAIQPMRLVERDGVLEGYSADTQQNIAYALAMASLLEYDVRRYLPEGSWPVVEKAVRTAFAKEPSVNDNSVYYRLFLDAIATRELSYGHRSDAKELRREVRANQELYP